MPLSFPPLPGVEVTVLQVRHHPQLSTKPGLLPFFYLIRLRNRTSYNLRFVARKWLLQENDRLQISEEAGLDGEMLALGPGKTYSYNGYHLVSSPARAQGTLFGLRDKKHPFCLPITPFELKRP